MGVTQKVSVALGREELRLAKTAADEDGVSLSSFLTRAVRERLEERGRYEAAQEVIATFSREGIPSTAEQNELLELWNRANRTPPKPKSPKRRASKRRSA